MILKLLIHGSCWVRTFLFITNRNIVISKQHLQKFIFRFPIPPEIEYNTLRLIDGIQATKTPPLMETPAINFRTPTERLEGILFISR